MITTKELLEKYPEIFKKIGGINYNLNQIEVSIISALSTFFIDLSNTQSEKTFIFSDALSDERVFPSIEHKRKLLVRVIKCIGSAARKNEITFDEAKWLSICESIRELQELRNDLAHNHLLFLKNGRIGYYIRKSHGEFLEDKRTGKTGSMKLIEIDLNEGFEKSEKILQESTQLMAGFSVEALNLLIDIANIRRDAMIHTAQN